MVYPGHPSRGCLQCIRRRVKIKCDEGKPECQRCIKRGETCPGYQRPKFRFVGSEASSSSSTRRRPNDPYPSRRPSVSSDTESSSPSSVTRATPCASVSRNWLDEAIPWYFRYYTAAQVELGEACWFDFLPPMYAAARDESHLRLAVQAAAFAGFANYLGTAQLASEALEVYGSALIALNAALRDNELAQQDETLTAAMNLVMFESITSYNSPLQSHIDGLLAILKLRGTGQFRTKQGRMLFRQVQLHLVGHPDGESHAIGLPTSPQQARALTPKAQNVGSVIESEVFGAAIQSLSGDEEGFALESQRLVLTVQMNRTCANAIGYIRGAAKDGWTKSTAAQLIQEATEVDVEHERWIAQVPVALRPRDIVHTQTGSRVLTHSSLMLAAVQNMHRSSRIILHEMRLRFATGLISPAVTSQLHAPPEKSYDAIVWESASAIRVIAEDIRASIPYCLGDIDANGVVIPEDLSSGVLASAYLLLWPLLVTRLATCTTNEQRQSATNTLERIGRKFGIKQALQLLRHNKGLFET